MVAVTLLTSLLAAGIPQVESLPRLDPRDSPHNGSSGSALPATSATSAASAFPTGVADCNDGSWELTTSNYERFMTDKDLQTWYNGGEDANGFTYKGNARKFPTLPVFLGCDKSNAAQPKENNDLTESLASTFGPVGSEQQFICTLETGTCNPAQDCNSYGVHLGGSSVGRPSHWAWFAIHSISSVYAFVQSFWKAFQAAGTALNFALLDLTKTFTKPSKDPQILTKDLLIGFGFVVTATFSLVPVAGTILGAAAAEAATAEVVGVLGAQAGAALSTANGILSNALSSGAPLDVKAAEFGAFMETVWNQTADGIDHLVQQMMEGSAMDGDTPLLFEMLNGGGWVDNKILTNPTIDVGALKNVLYKDLVQRGINHIWAQSKIWVSFVNLQDDEQTSKCLADKNGWQASKTCADGGVYYLYRFDEDGDENGHLDYPWGADQMTTDPWGLDPSWVTHSSASAYRSQNNGTGGFAYDPSQTPTNLPSLLSSISKSGDISNLNTLTGVWNLSVCDMGTHSDWNNDFTADDPTSPYGKMAFPCCCGEGCTQTMAFIQSAQMNGFDTIYNSCKEQLASCDAWPEGATEVDFGKAGTIEKDICK